MASWINKLELKDDELNVHVLKGIVGAHGRKRPGSRMRQDISAELFAAGWKHIPEKLPSAWAFDRFGMPTPIFIYRKDSAADRLITAVLKPEMGTVDLVRRAVKLISRDE